MAVIGTRVTVTTSATALIAAAADDVDGVSGAVKNPGTTTVDLGGSTVTTGTGFAAVTSEAVSIDLKAGETLYAITASGTQVIHVLRNSA